MSLTFATNSAMATQDLGRAIGTHLPLPAVVLLRGPLGAGKTTLVQGMANAYGILEPVRSPTFALAHEYRCGRVPLYHLDLYRLSGAEDVWDAGLAEYLETDGVTVIEWAERLDDLVPPDRLEIDLVTGDDNTREVTLAAYGTAYADCLARIGAGQC